MRGAVAATQRVIRAATSLHGRALAEGASEVAEDLSKVQRAAEMLRTLLIELPSRLSRASEPKDRRRVRHDLRTPLNQILGYCELVDEEAQDAGDERWGDDLAVILEHARELLELVDSVGVDHVAAVETRLESAGVPTFVGEGDTSFEGSGPIVLRDEREAGTILVVDDNEDNRDLLERRLSRDGFAVLTACNGAEALSVIRAQPVDVVLLDIMMPIMDGYETLERIKAEPELRHLPVIMLTSLDEADSITRCIEQGAEDHLPKPFDPVLLRARIGSSLERKKARDLERAQEQAVLDWLRGQGCNAYQGFLRFPPLPPGRFVEEVLSA